MKRNKHYLRYWIRTLHLWLGLISGVVVFIVSITGCIYVFQDDIKDALHPYRKISVEQGHFLQPAVLKNIALAAYPKGTVSRIITFNKERPAIVFITNTKASYNVYINPYSGKILSSENPDNDFFLKIKNLHTYLLLPRQIGKRVVDIAIMIFVVMLLTGLMLWWKAGMKRRQRFSIKWKARWRRVNYDLHSVPGFYAFLLALILAVTGLTMSYGLIGRAIYVTANFGNTYSAEKQKFPHSDTTVRLLHSSDSLLNHSYNTVVSLSPKAKMIITFMPFGPEGVFSISGYAEQWRFYKRNDYYFDQYTGNILSTQEHERRSAGAKINAMNYDLHTGQIFGMPGKIVAFLASLICASLPVTGFVIWWGRRKNRPYRPSSL